MPNEAWKKVGGYNENWGVETGEDIDFYFRLLSAGFNQKVFPDNSLTHIDHSFVSRVVYRPYRSIKTAEECDKKQVIT